MITQIELKAFKSFPNKIINFKPLTLLAGINNSGKSSVIQALRMYCNAAYSDSPLLDGHGPISEIHSLFSPSDETVKVICKFADNADIFGLAWFLHAVMLSINTNEQWEKCKLSIARTGDGQYRDERLSIRNIASYEHGRILHDEFSYVDVKAICDQCFLTPYFINWYEEQTDNNRQRVIDKLRLSCEKDFNGGEPLFKNLKNGNGLREIRFSAYPGGTIRILFKAIGDGKQAILIGFIKKIIMRGMTPI